MPSPSYWRGLQPDSPWEAGAPGWSKAPFVGWGQNPDRSLPQRLAVSGCGCSSAAPVGQDSTSITLPIWPIFALSGLLALTIWGTSKLARGNY